MIVAIAGLLAIAASAVAGPAMTVAAVPGKGYTITVAPFPVSDKARVVTALNDIAVKKCGALKVRWGRFHFETRYPGGAAGPQWLADYQQNFLCYDPATDPYKPVPADWSATPADNQSATDFVNRYLDLFQAGDVRAVAMFEPLIELSPDEWLVQPKVIKARIGTGSRQLFGPVWRINPETTGHPGAYVTFGFRGDYGGLQSYCGVVMLYRAGPGAYQISWQNIQVATKVDVAAGGVSATDSERACRDLLQ